MVQVEQRQTFRRTRAINRIRRMRKRIRVVEGGSSAGKTYGILPILIDRAIKTSLLEISVVAETMPHLKKGAVKDFKKIMKQTGRWKRAHWHESDKKYTFNNGSYIEFFSVDDESRVRGPRRNILYVNECNNIKFDTYYQLLIRTDMEVYVDYNPTHEFWINTEVIGNPNVEKITLTYKDNNALAKTIVRELESNLLKAYHNPKGNYDDKANIKNSFWANWCRVYLFGKLGILDGAVYTNWKAVDNIPPNARLLGYGLDFGYSNHPSALVACYILNGKYYFDELIYQKKLKSNDMAEMMKQLGVRKDLPIWCDAADPRMKDELCEYGYSVAGATKGPDSVIFGINILQQEKFYVTKRSLNMIKELRQYTWLKDKTGDSINKAIKAFDHAMDAMRYFAVMMISKHISYDDDSVEYYD